MDEDILMQRAVNGDVAAFGTLVKAHQQRLVRFAVRILSDRERAEDAVQEAFVRLWRTGTHYRPQGQLGCFLLRIVRNVCLDITRTSGAALPLEQAENLPAPGASLQQQVETQAMAEAVRKAVQALPEPQRAVFVLSQYEGLSYMEIAQVLDCPVGTVASRKRLAVEALQRKLSGWMEGEGRAR